MWLDERAEQCPDCSSGGSSYTARETDVKCNMRNAGERVRGEAAAAACVLWAGPCVWSAAMRHGPGCGGRGGEGLGILLIQRHRPPCLPGSVTAVLPTPRAQALLWLAPPAPSGCAAAGAKWCSPGPTPPVSSRPDPAGGGEADGVNAGGGGKDPTETSWGASHQGHSGPPPTAPWAGALDGGRGGGHGRTCTGREPPAGIPAGREFLPERFAWVGVKAPRPPQRCGRPWHKIPSSANCLDSSPPLKEKQTVTKWLRAWASF